MKKTKIICSIGPVSCNYETMSALVNSGMNVARINFSHASLEEREATVSILKKVEDELKTNIGLLYDTKGPEFRCKNMLFGEINLVEGSTIRIVKKDILGTEEAFSVNHPNVLNDLKEKDLILLENDLMKLQVVSKEKDGVTCKVLIGGKLGNKKSINIPKVKLNIPFISEEDKENIIYACKHRGDFLALSFVSSKEDVREVKEILKSQNREDMKIISKIESYRGVENIDEIIDESDGIMVARGDLGVEISMEDLPVTQKMIIRKCREKGKLCVVATEMLASMYSNPRPTRAEVTDIANAVFDGTDAIMLSGETTIGKYPVEAVKYMRDVCVKAEESYNYDFYFKHRENQDITNVIARSVVNITDIIDVKAIVAATISGYTAKKISNFKSKSPILAVCTSENVARGLSLNWGVITCVVPMYKSTEEVIEKSVAKAKEILKLKKNDKIVITGGYPTSNTHTTNFLRINEIKS